MVMTSHINNNEICCENKDKEGGMLKSGSIFTLQSRGNFC